MAKFTSVDQYIESFPSDVQVILTKVRDAIHRVAPNAEDGIRYDMPVVQVDGQYILHFAGWKKHIGIYPVPVLDGALEAEVAPYRAAKDTLRFPLRDPIPYELIARIAAAALRARGDAASST
jgi:uncharacterized protein YdhG (YjbR/CyaY superfamily)